MAKTYVKFEIRVEGSSDLARVKGRFGRKVFVEETGTWYRWGGSGWEVEAETGYKSYVCSVSQSGTDDPTEVVLGSPSLSLGEFLVWERMEVGIYRATLEGAFPEYRTHLLYPAMVLVGVAIDPPTSPPGQTFHPTYVRVLRIDDDTLLVQHLDADSEPLEGLTDFPLEIRVYGTHTIRSGPP